MGEAIDLLQARLRRKLEQRAQHRQALRRRAASSPPGEWHHGERPTTRPDFFQRPAEEREVVRHQSHVTHEMTPDEAAFDLEQLDLDFYLFRDIATGDDALLERVSDGSYRLARIRNSTTDSARPVVNPATAERSAPTLRLDEAIERIGAGGERFVFFKNTATGREAFCTIDTTATTAWSQLRDIASDVPATSPGHQRDEMGVSAGVVLVAPETRYDSLATCDERSAHGVRGVADRVTQSPAAVTGEGPTGGVRFRSRSADVE